MPFGSAQGDISCVYILFQRYTNSKLGFAGLRVWFYNPFVLFHYFLHHFKPQPTALAYGLSSKKRVENLIQDILTYARSIIDNADYHIVALFFGGYLQLVAFLRGDDPVVIWGSGRQRRNYLHAVDCADAMAGLVEQGFVGVAERFVTSSAPAD